VPVKPIIDGVRQCWRMFNARVVVLAAVRLVGDDDDVRAIRQHRHLASPAALDALELLDQREHVAVIGGQQLAQMRDGCRRALRALRHRPGVGELTVQAESSSSVRSVTITNVHLPGMLPQHLLGEPQHRQALARPLRVPEHTEPLVLLGTEPGAGSRWRRSRRGTGGAGDVLDQTARTLQVGDEVLEQVEQDRLRSHVPRSRGLQAIAPRVRRRHRR
jgi:hypothetical protein